MHDLEGIHIVPFQVTQPNFITSNKVTGQTHELNLNDYISELKGKIILLESADPGYDWIFSQMIGGLITRYGGSNSHMAIRCAEFDIPAAIGCGEQKFERYVLADQISLDCSAGIITIIN